MRNKKYRKNIGKTSKESAIKPNKKTSRKRTKSYKQYGTFFKKPRLLRAYKSLARNNEKTKKT